MANEAAKDDAVAVEDETCDPIGVEIVEAGGLRRRPACGYRAAAAAAVAGLIEVLPTNRLAAAAAAAF